MSKKIFRFLLIAEFVLSAASVGVSMATDWTLPPLLRDYSDPSWFADDLWTQMESLISWSITGLGLVGFISMLCFWRYARGIYLVSLILSIATLPMEAPLIDAGWGDMVGSAGTVLSGFILGLAYFSPIKRYFEPEVNEMGEDESSEINFTEEI